MATTTTLLAILLIGFGCGDKEDDTALPGDGGTTDGGTTDGGTTDGGTTDGGTTDGGMSDGGTTDGGSTDGGSAEFDGTCLMCHSDEEMLQDNVPGDTGEGAHEEPSGEG